MTHLTAWRRWLPVLVLAVLVGPAGAGSPVVDVSVLENSLDRIAISYTIAGCEMRDVTIANQAWSVPRLQGEAVMLEKGAPDLPKVCRSVIIPDDVEMSVSVVSADYYEISCDVAPSKGSIKRDVDPKNVAFEFGAAYGRNQFFPGELAALGRPYLLRDQRGVCVELFPLQYNPHTGILRVYTDLMVELTPAGPGQANLKLTGRQTKSPNREFEAVYSAQFLNYGATALRSSSPLDETGDMLIICYDQWLANIQPLVDHKNSLGINTLAVGVSTVGTDANSIKNYIQTVYDNSDLAFVLLVGDAAQVPVPTSSGGASDASYAKLAGDDNYPDIVVGRFSAETAADVDTQVARTIAYETTPAVEQAWFKRGIGIASAQGQSIGDESQSDIEHMNEIRGWLVEYDYTQIDQIYDPGALAATVTTDVNAGRGIINYCGHGSQNAWTTTGFSSTQVGTLTNYGQLPFIFSVACLNGRFAAGTCFGESWLRSSRNGQPIGAVAAYMSSIIQDWAPPMEAQDQFNLLLTGEGYFSFGALCYAGSCSMMDQYGSDMGTPGVETFDTWILFGDPSLRVFGTAERHLLGDMNCDDAVNTFDIDPFVLALTSPTSYAATYPECDMMRADVNSDGAVNVFDIDPFVVLLTSN